MLALLEVMDKEPSLGTVLAIALILCLLAFLASAKKPVLLALVLPVAALLHFAILSEVTDPLTGPAIRLEAGLPYAVLSWLSPLLTSAAVILGLLLRRTGRCNVSRLDQRRAHPPLRRGGSSQE